MKLGYKDEELRAYVKTERDLLTAERAAERDTRAKERDFREKEMIEADKAMKAKEHELIMLMKIEELKKKTLLKPLLKRVKPKHPNYLCLTMTTMI